MSETETDSAPRWSPGDAVVLRYLTRDDRPGMSWPCRVVVDSVDLVALYMPRGSTYKNWQPHPERGRHLADAHWRRDVLRLMYPGRGYSIWVQWDDTDERGFRGWYVNFEEPFRRTPIGFDTNDHTLDIVIAPDLSWSWKDAEEFDRRVAEGLFSTEFAASLRDEANRVIADIGPDQSPFSDGWETWTPDAAWPLPTLDASWQEVPVEPWPNRRWAYLSIR